MINEQDLFAELEAADKAGDTEHARMIANKIQEQRTAWSKANNLANNNIVDKYGIEGAEAKLREQGKGYSVADDMSGFEKVVTGIGRGGVDVGQGVKQLAFRAAEAKGFPMGDAVENLDHQIKKENEQFNKDFEGDWYAKGGRIGGQMAATAPAGMGVGALLKPAVSASRSLNALNYGKQGLGVGATEAAMMPTFGDNFWTEKAAQVGVGSALGTSLGTSVGALKGGRELLSDGVGATVQNAVNKGSNNKIARAFVGDSAERAENQALSARTGVALTPAEESGSRFGQGLESLAEQNLLTADDVLEKVTLPQLNQVKNYALKQADNISKSVKSVDQVGRDVQKLTNTITDKLVQSRSEAGRKLYGEIDRAAGGQNIVKIDNLNRALDEIIEEVKGVKGHTSKSLVNEAKALKASLNPKPKVKPYSYSSYGAKPVDDTVDSSMSASTALRQLQSWSSPKSGRIFKDIDDYGVNEHYKKKLADAILSDMDNVQGALGDKVRNANAVWRKGSEEIDALAASILGKVAGKNLASEINGFITNSIPPEKVIDTFRRARPTEIQAAMKYMDKYDPKMAKEFRSNYIRMAVEEAMVNANSSGAQQMLNPTQLLSSLGVRSGKGGVEGIDKLKIMFGQTPQGKQFVKDIIQLSRIKADAFGRNFSGTAVQNEANRLLSGIGQFMSGFMTMGKQAAGTIGHALGIKSVANNMIDQTPFTKTINPATNAGGYSALVSAPVVNEVNEK